jgi:predicted TIM-barrel fold metal-dependent hydrolase
MPQTSAHGDAWIFDADGHAIEPDAIWTELLPRAFHAYAPRVVEFEDHFRYVCNGRIGFRIHAAPQSLGTPGQTTRGGSAGTPARGGSQPGPRLEDMAQDGIGRAAIYPTQGLMIQGVEERAPARALCRAVNDWLAEYCRHAPDRLLAVGTLPMADAGDALDEARRCVERLGMHGVWRRPEHWTGIPRLHDAGYEPLFAYLAEAGVPLAIHPGLNGVVPYAYFGERFEEDYAAMHAVHFPVEQIMSLTEVIAFGILERHPALRVAFLETGAVWALAHLHRLDEHLETFGFPRGRLSLRPSEYFRRQCFVSCEEVEPGLDRMLSAYPDSVVFASDYPHGDCTFPGSTRELLETPALDDATRERILRANALRLYGLAATPA